MLPLLSPSFLQIRSCLGCDRGERERVAVSTPEAAAAGAPFRAALRREKSGEARSVAGSVVFVPIWMGQGSKRQGRRGGGRGVPLPPSLQHTLPPSARIEIRGCGEQEGSEGEREEERGSRDPSSTRSEGTAEEGRETEEVAKTASAQAERPSPSFFLGGRGGTTDGRTREEGKGGRGREGKTWMKFFEASRSLSLPFFLFQLSRRKRKRSRGKRNCETREKG